MDRSKQLSKICSRPDLSIKCSKSKKSCSCSPQERRRKFKKWFSKCPDKFSRKRFFRKKRSFKKSTKYFLCRKEGHFAKNCPNKSAKKKQYLINSISEIAPDIDFEGHDLESVLSYDSDDNDAICGYSDYDNSSESSPDEDDDCCFKIIKMPRHDEIQTPHLPVTIFDPSCQEDPVHAIAFIDTRAHTTIINPKILSPSMWLPHQQEFRVANSGSLTIKLKSKPIKIELFPGCHIITEVLGSAAPGKDLILGWDSYYAFKKTFDISIEPRGLRWKNIFKAFTTIPRLSQLKDFSLKSLQRSKKNWRKHHVQTLIQNSSKNATTHYG